MPKILATDLDGTLIPQPENEANRRDIEKLSELLAANDVELLFVTGRHLASIEKAIHEEKLPTPNWIIGDVGTTLYERTEDGSYQVFNPYRLHLEETKGDFPKEMLQNRCESIPGMRLQEPEKLGQFKLSYYTDAEVLPSLVERFEAMIRDEDLDCALIHSIDPHDDGGLIDFLPKDVSKAYALEWWRNQQGYSAEEIVFSGDSGNDLAAFLGGYRAIVVQNTKQPIPRNVFDYHRQQGWLNRFYHSDAPATSGVLEGCRYFGLFNGDVDCKPQKPGATPVRVDETYFRVWVPKGEKVHVQVKTAGGTVRQEMTSVGDGVHEAFVANVSPGDQYYYELAPGVLRPDPVSYEQTHGVHNESTIVDHHTFPWQDADWQGVAKQDLVIYELHVGTFTEEGTYRGVIDRLDYLLDLGVTAIELMPLAQTPGRWNWGYDGVNLYAPNHNYGTPDDLKALIDACHNAGIAVLLDVVYNHLGPEGNYLADFGPYFSKKHHTPWGSAFNLDGPAQQSEPVRAYIIENALYWLREYHFDGLRLDAIHHVHDDSRPHITEELAKAVADFKETAGRTIHLIAESNVYDPELLSSENPGKPELYDACWCDDIMYSLYSLVLPKMQLPNRVYHGVDDFAESLQYGYIYTHGGNLDEYTRMTDKKRTDFHPNESNDYLHSLIVGLQTHDAVGNHPQGKRFHQLASMELQKAATALVLLYPTIPILFMGEEYATDSLFPFFTDFTDQELRTAVNEGRKQEFEHHDWSDSFLPCQDETFHVAKLNDMPQDGKSANNNTMLAWYRSLLHLRRKGLSQGWLTPKYLEITVDKDAAIYKLEYKDQEKTYLSVVARIARPETKLPVLEYSVPDSLTLRLDSKKENAGVASSDAPVLLEVPHAVVFA